VKKVIKRLEQAAEAFDSFLTLKGTDDRLCEAYGEIKIAIKELQAPRWETPEQYGKRTGKPWPDNWAVYERKNIFIGGEKDGEWRTNSLSGARGDFWVKEVEPDIVIDIVCATEAGPPPDDWKPEEEK
jgi:hypothetical protein